MSTMKNLFGSSGMGDLFNSQPVEPSKEILDMFKPVDTAVMSEQAQKMAEQHARLIQEGISAGQQATAEANARLEAMKRETQANMEAVLRMQEERRKAEEEAKKEAERKAKEEEKARKEALKELEDAVKDDPLTLVRQDMEALFNSDAYKEAGDVQRRDLINAMATDLEKALREKGLKQELITKSINAFKTAGSQNVDKYIADSEKDDWGPIDDLIKPVISGFKKGQAANAVKDSAIIDKAIADLKAGKEVSGWAVDEILDRDPSLRKYMTNTGVYSSLTQGVGSSFKLRAGVADEFSKAAGKTWQSAIDDATNYDKTAKELDRQRSADTVRHHKNYEYELAKIENDEKSGKIGWFDSMLSQGMVAISNPTVTLDKIAPSTATFIAETATLQGAAAATGAVVGGAAGFVVGGLSTAGAGAIPTALAWGKAGAALGAGLANGGKVVKYIATGINALRNGMASAEMTEDEIINNTREQLMALDVKNEADLKKLKSLPYWDEMVARSDGNLELAKVRMSAFASQDAAFAGSIVAAATGILGPEAILSKGLTGVIVKSALKKPVVGMAVTGKTAGAVALASVLEGGEEAMTQYLTNFATAYGSSDESLTKRIRNAMNNDPSLLDGTAGAFAQGAIGGGMVAGIGAGMQLSGDIKTTTEANTAYRIANDATSYNREGVEALKTALTSNDKLDKAFIEETVHKAMRSHTRDLSAYAKYYDATAEQTAQQEVYDNIIEPALEGSQLTTEQTQDIIKKLSLVYDNLNTNKYAIAEETPLLKAMQAETLEEAEKIYGQPLSTLRADTWRVLNNKDTSVVADLEHAQATAEVIRNILQGGGENTIQRSNNVLRTVFGYTDEATNKYHDGILQRYRLDDSKIDAILEMARNDLDAYRRRGLDNEQETKQPSAQTGRHPNGGTVPQDGGPSRSQDTGTVGETATGSQTQEQPTNGTGLGGQDTTGQTTADTQSGRSRGKRQATATQPTTSSTQEADSPATGTTETQGTVPNTDSPTATRPVSETPTVDGGNGPQSQTPEHTGPTNTPTESTPTSGRSTGATPTERSADGERTTTPTEADFEQLKEAIQRLSKEDLDAVKLFAYLSYKESANLRNRNSVKLEHMATAMMNISMTDADNRYDSVARVYLSDAAKRYKYDMSEVEALTLNILDLHDILMDAVARGSDGKKTYLGAKKAKPVTEPTAEPTTEPKAKGKGGTSKKKPTATTTDTTPVAEPTTETTATEPKSKPKTKGKLTSTKPTTKRGTKNDEETSTGEQTASTRTDDETSESGSRSDSKPSDEQSGTVREQSPVNDGKNQTAKSAKPDVRQETEVAPFGTLEANTSADTPSYAEPKWRRGSLSYPNESAEQFKSQGSAAARRSRQDFISSYGEAKPTKEAVINELNEWHKVVGDALFESPLFPVLHELLNRTSVVAPHFVLRVNKHSTSKDKYVGGHHNAIAGTLWLNKNYTTNYITTLKDKNPSKEDIVFAITQALITPVHELVHAVTVNNITKPENSLALNSLLSMRDMIIDGIGRPEQHYDIYEFYNKMAYLAENKNHSIGRSAIGVTSAIVYGLSLKTVGGGDYLRVARHNDRNSVNEFIAVGMSDPAMAALIDQYVDVKALLKEYPELKNIIKNRKRTAWQVFSDIVLSVLGKKKSPSPYDVYQAVVESVMYEKNSPYIEAMRKDHANDKIDITSITGTFTYEQYLAFVSGAREALTADTLANVESLVPPTTLEEFKQRIRKKDTKGLPTQEVVDMGVMKGTKPTDPMVSENWNYSQASIDIFTNDLLKRPMPKWTTKAIVKAILEAIPETIKKSMAVVSIALAATLGSAMTVPVDAQASTTTYTQTVLSQQVKDTASHVVQTKDNEGKPFIVADKLSGNITLFDANGKVLETAGALFGSEVGDTINSAEQRATPAGRFELDYSKASDTKLYGSHTQHLKGTEMTGADGTEYVWAIHRVINPKGENRLNRLSSKTASDNRISNGCINVPAEFFNKHLDKPFDGVLYVLPETANFNGTLFNNSTVSDSTTATEQSGRSANQTGTDSKQTSAKADKTPATSESTTEKPELTSEQTKSLGTSRLLTDRDLAENVAETLRTTLPDAPAQVSTEPARMSENPSSQTALIDPVTVDGTTYNTASVNEGQTTPAEERADTTFDTLPTTQTSSDGYGVFDIAVALGGLFAVGGVVRFRRKRKNGKVEVVAEVEKGSNDDTTADTVEATEPKPAKEKTKKTKLTSRKKSEKLGFNPDNPTELAKAIREQLYALEDLQTNVQAQNLLMALAGKPNVGSIMYAASYNTMVREINNSFNDRTKAQVDAGFDDEQTLDWRGIRKKGANDDITATNLVAKAFNRYIQFAGGATPTLDTYLKDAGAKRIGILQDSYALSAALAKIPAVRNALFGRFATQMLKPIDREMQKVTFNAEYAKRIRALHGRSPKQGELGYDIAHDFGMYATLQHGLEAWDWFVKSREYTAEEYTKQADKAIERIKQDLESKAPHEVEQILELVKAGNHVELEQMFDAYGMTTSMRSRIKTLTSSYGKLTRKAQDIRDETEAIEAYYENESGITGATAYPLPIGMVKADIEAKIKELEDLYGKDDLDKMAKRLYDGYTYAVRDSVMHGGYTAQQLEQIKAPKFKKYVALYKRKEKETDTSGDIYQATELDAWTQAGLTSKEVLTLGLTPDMTRFHREGMTTPPDDAYTNLRSFAQNQMGRAAESELKREMQELAESFDEGQIPFDKLTYDPTKAQDTAIKGIVRIPADTKNGHIPDNLKNVVPIRARGVYYELVQDPNDPKKSTYEPREADFNYYFTDSNIQREITHKSETNEKLKRGMFTGNLYTIQRWQASMMTRLRPVWNFWNFVKEASERTITLLYRPVADEDGKRINSFKLAKDNLKNLAKLSTDLEAQAQITNYIMYREVVTPLQRMLAEMDEAGALQLYTSTVDRHNAMDTETKSALDILSEHAHKNAKKLASKYKATEKAMESAEALADWYQTRLVETPQVVNALAVFMTYKQNNVNRKEAANRVRDMFDPLRTQEPLINKLAAFFPFVRSAMAGNYNTARTLDIMTQDRQAMLATVLGVMASFALLGLALAALGDDDETGEPLWERLTFDDLARGVPVRLFGNDVFFVPVGFGMPNLLWSIAAGVFSGINSGFDFQDAVAGISTTAIKNLLPVSLPTGESNSSMKGAILMFMPAMVKPLMEVALNQKAFGGSPIVRNQNIPEGYSKAEVSQWSTPEAYKDMAMTLSSMGIDMHPEQLRHLMQNYFFVGPFRAMDAMLQDKGDKTGGVMVDKGETVGPILSGFGVDIGYQPDRFSMRNAFYELQKLEKEILRKYDVREKLSGADTLDDTTEFIGMDGLDDSMIKKDDSNLARIRNELVAKGATLDEVQMVLDIRTANDAYTKANREAGNEAIHYLRGLEKGEFSDVSSPDVYRDKFLAAHYDMQTVVKKHIHLLTED